MPTVTVCSSSKFYDIAKMAAKRLDDLGCDVFTPDFDFNETVVDVNVDKKRELTLTFLDKIKSSDVIYVIDIDGYIGRSVAIEVGYAAALGPKILLLEPPAEFAVRALTTGVLGIEELSMDVLC